MMDGNATSESHVSMARTQQEDGTEPNTIFEWLPKQADEEAHHWLHQERLCTPRTSRIIERNAIKFKMGDGSVAWRRPYKTLVGFQNGRKERMEIAGNCDIVLRSMLYGRGERLRKH